MGNCYCKKYWYKLFFRALENHQKYIVAAAKVDINCV